MFNLVGCNIFIVLSYLLLSGVIKDEKNIYICK